MAPSMPALRRSHSVPWSLSCASTTCVGTSLGSHQSRRAQRVVSRPRRR
jgi:Na+-driven multidrug efflux pump